MNVVLNFIVVLKFNNMAIKLRTNCDGFERITLYTIVKKNYYLKKTHKEKKSSCLEIKYFYLKT